MNILIVDDSAIIRKNIGRLIAPHIAESKIHYATNVDEAIVYLQSVQFGILIIDIRMPGGSGFDVLKEAKLKDPAPLVIMLTNYASESYRKRAMKEGADYFFDKSIDYEEILKIIEKKRDADLPKILIVDDSQIQIKLLEKILEKIQATIIQALSGKEALSLTTVHDFAMILMDVQMPVMNGFETAEILMANEKTKHIPIIFITGNSKNETDVWKGFETGAVDYIFKPAEPAILKSKIRIFLEIYKKGLVDEKYSKLKQSHNELILMNDKLESMTTELGQQASAFKTLNEELEEKTSHLEKQNNAFFNIVGRSETGILILDKTGIIKFLNPAAERLFKKDSNKLLGQQLGFPIQSDHNIELDIYRGDGSVGIGQMTSTLTEWEKEKAYLIYISDITRLKINEKELMQSTVKLKEQNEDLDAYSHTVAHDLRGHLEVMTGYANLLYHDFEELTKDKIQKYSEYIYKTGNTLTNVIKELLLFASMDSLDDKVTEINIMDTVTNVVEEMSGIVEKNKTEIKLPDTWPTILSYGPLVEEIWKNYISNAIKYGGTPPKIEIGWEYDDSDTTPKLVKYWITDNGAGINEEKREIIFEKFNRLNKAKASGYGLGLSIVRRITNKLGGKSGVESAEGTGSKFYFTFPAGGNEFISESVSIENVNENNTSNDQLEDQNINKKKTVLIVEDTDVSYQLLKIILERSGVHIIRANNGKVATELCSENENINLVLMDIQMPVMDGYEATRIIKKFRPELPIIAITAYSFFGDRGKSYDAGCDDYLTKPIKMNEFLKKMGKYINVLEFP